jgi:hypothetical protein
LKALGCRERLAFRLTEGLLGDMIKAIKTGGLFDEIFWRANPPVVFQGCRMGLRSALSGTVRTEFLFCTPIYGFRRIEGPETVIGEADGPTSILVSGGFSRGFSLSDGIILSFALFAASFVGAVLLKRKQKR